MKAKRWKFCSCTGGNLYTKKEIKGIVKCDFIDCTELGGLET